MSGLARDDDLIQPFQVESGPVRGRLVRLGPVLDTILSRHDYPEAVAVMLGEMLVLTAATAGALKFDGLFTLQSQSDGPISMMVTDLTTPGAMRGYAKYDRAALDAALGNGRQPGGSVPRLLGAGHLVFSVDVGPETELYQGYVELEGATLAECAHNYFRQSEQLDAGLRLAASRIPYGADRSRWRAGGLMVQRLPETSETAEGDWSEEDEDAWRHTLALVGNLRDDELTDPQFSANDILYRLFHESGVRVFRPVDLAVGCRCNRGRIQRMLESFGPEQLADMVVRGRIIVTCEFCNTVFTFAESDIAHESGP